MRRRAVNEVVASFDSHSRLADAQVAIASMSQTPGHVLNEIDFKVAVRGTNLEISWRGDAIKKPGVQRVLEHLGGRVQRSAEPDWS